MDEVVAIEERLAKRCAGCLGTKYLPGSQFPYEKWCVVCGGSGLDRTIRRLTAGSKGFNFYPTVMMSDQPPYLWCGDE